jgi:predicted O-methyltransferase YrrM
MVAKDMDDKFAVSDENRHLWHQLDSPSGGPFYFLLLSEVQRQVLRDWLTDTSSRKMIGETSVSAIGMMAGLVLGNRIERVAQCGHYAGFSLLVLGMLMQQARIPGRIVSVDIDQHMTNYTRSWIDRAGLSDIATAEVLDSGDPFAAWQVEDKLGGSPELLFVDSSHQYRHTLEEMDLWSQFVKPGGFICLHDVSAFSSYQDANGLGGVPAALREWLPRNPNVAGLAIDPGATDLARFHAASPVYRDPCGFGLLQVQNAPMVARPARPGRKRMIADPGFRFSDNWVLGEGWAWESGGVVKAPGVSSGLSCFSPVIAGERYRVIVELADVTEGGVHPGAGAGELSADFFSCDGRHEAVIEAGGGNSLMGLLASANFVGRVLRFEASPIGSEM